MTVTESTKAEDLPDLQLKLGQVVIDAETAAGLSVLGRPLLYHGRPIDDCCPPDGGKPKLYVWWTPIDASSKDPCGGPIPVTVHLRQLFCWPVPSNPVHANPGPFSEAAAHMARCADAGTRGLAALLCDGGYRRSLGIARVEMLPTTPRDPKGGCAGLDWVLKVWPTREGWRS